MTSRSMAPPGDPLAPARRSAHPGIRVPRPVDVPAARSHAQLMPTLFDRLRDEHPTRASESPSAYTLRPAQVRDIVQRDLGCLLNTTNAEGLIDRERHPEAASSSLNFGVPPLAGGHLSEHRWADVERLVRRAIADYEPRLLPGTVSVRPLMKDGASDASNVLVFEIRAMVDLQPYPLELTVQTSVDLETHRMSVTRSSPAPVSDIG